MAKVGKIRLKITKSFFQLETKEIFVKFKTNTHVRIEGSLIFKLYQTKIATLTLQRLKAQPVVCLNHVTTKHKIFLSTFFHEVLIF